MIYTLTLNPAIDMNITAACFSENAATRTKDMVLTPNGKGINVAFVLKRFGKRVGALGFFGGFTGKYIVEKCEEAGIKTLPVWIENDTRVNVFLTSQNKEYKFINEGASVNADDEQAMLRTLESLQDLEVLTVNGSPAKNGARDFYDKIARIAKAKGAKLVFDISTPKLRELLQYEPILIKPNDEELKDVFGIKITDINSVKAAVRALREQGAQNVLLTLGGKGSYFYNGRELFYSGVQTVKARSSLCAGDGFLAAFLSVWLEDENDVEKALKIASATGANIAESDGLGDLEKVEQYKNNILVKKI